jgi:hypothetical protein
MITSFEILDRTGVSVSIGYLDTTPAKPPQIKRWNVIFCEVVYARLVDRAV